MGNEEWGMRSGEWWELIDGCVRSGLRLMIEGPGLKVAG